MKDKPVPTGPALGCFFWIEGKCQYQAMIKKPTDPCPFLKEESCTAETKEDFAQVIAKYQQEI